MKIITRNSDNEVLFMLDDSIEVTVTEDDISYTEYVSEIDKTIDNVIWDLNSSNATVHENVTVPEGAQPRRKTFDGTTWADNPNYTEPLDI
jgi:hypothetical protein